MNKLVQRTLLLTILSCIISLSHAQFGIGFTVTQDLYNRYSNPIDSTGEHRANGSALLNLGIGPKIWFGGENFSLSVETQANLGILAFSLPNYKGLGNVSFPIMGKINFAGVSALSKEGRFGLSLGGGIQFNKTELYYITNDFKAKGGERNFFKTYVIQAGYGFGISGFAVQFFTRYGFNSDLDGANSLNIGLQFDFNIPKMKKIDDPNSRL
ncbi:MAG: hypothetical protein HKO66_15955 [Saprospiraceae bacterium]|nr:hypothetical protein [Bacteroidia bacterium]NNL93737.1 hypothetical protein [Saprospiraceae bacterium]